MSASLFLIWLKIKRHWTGAICPSVVTPGSSMLLLTVQPLKQVKCCQRYHKGPSLVLCYFWATSTVHVCLVPLSEGSMTSMYADDILLGMPIHHPENCDDIQRDINWCHPWRHKHQYIFNTRGSNPSKCKYLGCFGKKNYYPGQTTLNIIIMLQNQETLCLGWHKCNALYQCHLHTSMLRVWVSIVGLLHNSHWNRYRNSRLVWNNESNINYETMLEVLRIKYNV